MTRHTKILAASAACTAAVVLGLAATALASLPAGTSVTGTSPSTVFKGTINGIPITVTCTTFSESGTIPSGSPYTLDVPPPTIAGCTDSLGYPDTITTNDTNGSWTLTEGKTENSKKDYTMTLTMPVAGATFTSKGFPGCVITAAPTKKVGLKGEFNGNATDTVTKAKITVRGANCTATKSSATTTITFSPALGPPPF